VRPVLLDQVRDRVAREHDGQGAVDLLLGVADPATRWQGVGEHDARAGSRGAA